MLKKCQDGHVSGKPGNVGILLKVREVSEKIFSRKKWPKTVHCQLQKIVLTFTIFFITPLLQVALVIMLLSVRSHCEF